MSRAYLALGSNLGDRWAYLRGAVEALDRLQGSRVVAASRVYETDPVGGPAGQGPYLNAAIVLDTELEPRALISALLAIEKERGRERRERWGARTLDLDLLLYDDEAISEADLTVPHPRLAERAFVLAPLADLASDLVPVGMGRTVSDLLSEVGTSGIEVVDGVLWPSTIP
jgi:2-amino-4-hydroxy-6-hydroxymethyldihydropteridine diphosphokinase